MAQALAEAGNEVTLLTALGTGTPAIRCRNLLDAAPFNSVIIPMRHPSGYARINTKLGEPISANGRWPRLAGLAPAAEELAPQHDCILTDCNIEATQLRRIIALHDQTLLNATATRASRAILQNKQIPKAFVTMNKAEAASLARASGTKDAQAFLKAVNAQAALITLSAKGWTLYRQDEPDLHSAAVPVPTHSDFVGCGDYASAGLIHAVLHNTDLQETINAFISRKLATNKVPPIT